MQRSDPKAEDPKTEQRLMWERLDAMISDHGAWTVSAKHQFPIRFECEPNNTLPQELRKAGYIIINSGSAERFRPFSEKIKLNPSTQVERQHLALAPIDIWSLDLE